MMYQKHVLEYNQKISSFPLFPVNQVVFKGCLHDEGKITFEENIATEHGGAISFSERDGQVARDGTCPIELVPGHVQVSQ